MFKIFFADIDFEKSINMNVNRGIACRQVGQWKLVHLKHLLIQMKIYLRQLVVGYSCVLIEMRR